MKLKIPMCESMICGALRIPSEYKTEILRETYFRIDRKTSNVKQRQIEVSDGQVHLLLKIGVYPHGGGCRVVIKQSPWHRYVVHRKIDVDDVIFLETPVGGSRIFSLMVLTASGIAKPSPLVNFPGRPGIDIAPDLPTARAALTGPAAPTGPAVPAAPAGPAVGDDSDFGTSSGAASEYDVHGDLPTARAALTGPAAPTCPAGPADADDSEFGTSSGAASEYDIHGEVKSKILSCRCGLGPFLVLTTKSGKKFYNCPRTQKNGGCGFQDWCDSDDRAESSKKYSEVESRVLKKNCRCGLGPCLVLTTKSGKKFYNCPRTQKNGGCGFQEWCDSDDRAGSSRKFSEVKSRVLKKSCQCGLEDCSGLTSKSGQKFYKCSQRQENGGCGFFESCSDKSISVATGISGSDSTSAPAPALECPCGAGLCLILRAKYGNNNGRQFYKCPANKERACGFCKWI